MGKLSAMTEKKKPDELVRPRHDYSAIVKKAIENPGRPIRVAAHFHLDTTKVNSGRYRAFDPERFHAQRIGGDTCVTYTEPDKTAEERYAAFQARKRARDLAAAAEAFGTPVELVERHLGREGDDTADELDPTVFE